MATTSLAEPDINLVTRAIRQENILLNPTVPHVLWKGGLWWRGKSVYQINHFWQRWMQPIWERFGYISKDTSDLATYKAHVQKTLKDRGYPRLEVIVIDKPCSTTTAAADTTTSATTSPAISTTTSATASAVDTAAQVVLNPSPAPSPLEQRPSMEETAEKIRGLQSIIDDQKRQLEQKDRELSEAQEKHDCELRKADLAYDDLKITLEKTNEELQKTNEELRIATDQLEEIRTKSHDEVANLRTELANLQRKYEVAKKTITLLRSPSSTTTPVPASPLRTPAPAVEATQTPVAKSPLVEEREGLDSPNPSVRANALFYVTQALTPFLVGNPNGTRKSSGTSRVLFEDALPAEKAKERDETRNKKIQDVRAEIVSSPSCVEEAKSLLTKAQSADKDNHHRLNDCKIDEEKLRRAIMEDVD